MDATGALPRKLMSRAASLSGMHSGIRGRQILTTYAATTTPLSPLICSESASLGRCVFLACRQDPEETTSAPQMLGPEVTGWSGHTFVVWGQLEPLTRPSPQHFHTSHRAVALLRNAGGTGCDMWLVFSVPLLTQGKTDQQRVG